MMRWERWCRVRTSSIPWAPQKRCIGSFRHNICTGDWIAFPGDERLRRPRTGASEMGRVSYAEQCRRRSMILTISSIFISLSFDSTSSIFSLQFERMTPPTHSKDCPFCPTHKHLLPPPLLELQSQEFTRILSISDEPS